MNENILETIKEMLSITTDDDSFDAELIPLINTQLAILRNVGTTSSIFKIDADTTWDEYYELLDPAKDTSEIPTYIYIRVKLIFDPPQNSSYSQSLKETADKLEWLICDEFDM